MAKYFATLAILLLILVGIIYIRTDEQIQTPGDGVEVTEIPRVPEARDLRSPADEEATGRQPGQAPRPLEQPLVERQAEADRDALDLYRSDGDEPAETRLPDAEVPGDGAVPLERPAPLEPRAEADAPDLVEERVDDLLPYPWTGRVQENQPGFVEPNRLDARQPSGAPVLSDPLPTGPEAGFYDRQERR